MYVKESSDTLTTLTHKVKQGEHQSETRDEIPSFYGTARNVLNPEGAAEPDDRPKHWPSLLGCAWMDSFIMLIFMGQHEANVSHSAFHRNMEQV